MIPNIGELAALLTAVCFSASSIFFTRAGKIYGALISNRLRLAVAVILLLTSHWIIFGYPIPVDAGVERWLWLGSSGIIGLAIGDFFLFQACHDRPEVGLLFLSLSPAVATILAWFVLERPGCRQHPGYIVYPGRHHMGGHESNPNETIQRQCSERAKKLPEGHHRWIAGSHRAGTGGGAGKEWAER
jgi:hypothetical protein